MMTLTRHFIAWAGEGNGLTFVFTQVGPPSIIGRSLSRRLEDKWWNCIVLISTAILQHLCLSSDFLHEVIVEHLDHSRKSGSQLNSSTRPPRLDPVFFVL